MRVLMLHRPTSIIGGDVMACHSYGAALERLGVEVEYRPASQVGEVISFDYVHMWAACSPDWGLPAARAVKAQRIPLLLTTFWWSRDARQSYYGHAGQDLAPGYLQSVADTMHLADVLLTCTMSEAAECWKLVPRKRVWCIGYGHDPIDIQPREPQGYVTCLGRIERHKNQLNLAHACKLLKVPLVLVGPSVDDDYAAKARALGATLLGGMKQAEAMEILAGARVHCLPSISETPGHCNMEAGLLGVPFVMGNIGAEVEFYGENGIYCDPTDPYDIAAAIQIAWNRPRTVWQIPTWDDVAATGKAYMEGGL